MFCSTRSSLVRYGNDSPLFPDRSADGILRVYVGVRRMGLFRELHQSELTHRVTSVYMYLTVRSDKEGEYYPSIGTIKLNL